MRALRLLLTGLLIAGIASASIPPMRLGLGFGAATGGLQIITSSLTSVPLGTAATQTLSITGGSGGDACSLVSATPNTGLWNYITPGCTVSGTPQMLEAETVTYQVTDQAGHIAQKTFTLTTTTSGALAFVSPTTIPTATANGSYNYHVLFSGGSPPYHCGSSNAAQPWNVTYDCWIEGTPTSTGTVSISVTGTDANGTAVTQSESITVNAALILGGVDPTDGVIHLPSAIAGQHYKAILLAYGGSGTGFAFSATGLPAWATLSSGGIITGEPALSGAVEFTAKVTDSATTTATATALVNISSAYTATRPAYNSDPSNGFFVLGGRLYDPNGKLFVMAGVNQLHYDSGSESYVPNTNANAVRIWDAGDSTTTYNTLANAYIAAHIFPILTMAYAPGGVQLTGSTDPAVLEQAVSWWVANESAFSAIMPKIAVNVANEWGPGAGSTVWEGAYMPVTAAISAVSGTTITVSTVSATNPFVKTPFAYIGGSCGVTDQMVNLSAPGGSSGAWTVTSSVSLSGYAGAGCTLYGGAISALRAAGYTAPIIIDLGNYGSDFQDIPDYAAAIQGADPLQNVIFSYHGYGTLSNVVGLVSGVTKGSTTTITLSNGTSTHPFDPSWNGSTGNTYSGIMQYSFTGVLGATQLNGAQPSSTHVGGTGPGAWTLSLSANSTAWGTYTSGGLAFANSPGNMADGGTTLYYSMVAQDIASFENSNVDVIVGEYGPGTGGSTGTPGGIGPSPGIVSLGQMTRALQSYGVGGLYWAWDDNNATGDKANYNGWFGMTGVTGSSCSNGQYPQATPSCLTAEGFDMALNPRYGLNALPLEADSLH